MPLPVEAFGRWGIIVPFPPHRAIGLECHVGVNRVVRDGRHRIRIGLGVGPWGHTEITRLGIDGPQASVRTRPHPGDVIAHGPNLPTLETLRGIIMAKFVLPQALGKAAAT